MTDSAAIDGTTSRGDGEPFITLRQAHSEDIPTHFPVFDLLFSSNRKLTFRCLS